MGDNHEMTFLELNKKVATLLMLLTGKRVNSIHHYDVEFMKLSKMSCTFYQTVLLKHDRPGRFRSGSIVYKMYPHNALLCPVTAIADLYVRRAQYDTATTKLFIATTKPYGAACKNTVAGWIKKLLSSAGVNTKIYSAHSCRSAASSKALDIGIPLQEILSSCDWSSQRTFHKHYKKEIEEAHECSEQVYMGNTILDNVLLDR